MGYVGFDQFYGGSGADTVDYSNDSIRYHVLSSGVFVGVVEIAGQQ